MRYWTLLVGISTVLLLPSPAAAQANGLSIDDVRDNEYPIVEVTVTVPEGVGRTRLSKEPFTVTEDGGPPTQPYLGSSPEEEEQQPPPAPHVVLAIDTSGSMKASIDQAKTAADNFVASLPQGSQVAVVTFGDVPDVLVQSTADLRAVRAQIAAIEIRGNPNTALNAGVRSAARLVSSQAGQTGNVVVLSDGRNTIDDVSQDAAIAVLTRRRVRLWAVELESDQQDHKALVALAGDPGRVLTGDADDLDGIYQGLASNFSRQYVLRYESQANGRTDITVAFAFGGIRTERTRTVSIDATNAPPKDQRISSVPSDSFEVSVPLLGTTGAYMTGLGAVAIANLIIWTLVLYPRSVRPGERLSFEFQQRADRSGPRLTALAQWTADATDRRLRRGSLGARLDQELESAGLDLRPGELVVIIISMMVVILAFAMLFGNLVLGLLFVPLLPMGVRLWLGIRRDKRQAAFSEQLTDVLQLIAGSLRAGYGLTQGIDAVSRDAEEPAAGEFRRIIIEHRLGRDLDEAMENCAMRMDNADFAWVVQAISIHRDVGGDLAKVLDNIIATIRDRADVHRQVQSLSAEGRLSARVLTALPILVLIALQVMSPTYLQPLVTNPIGLTMLAAAALFMMTGILVIRRMANIQY